MHASVCDQLHDLVQNAIEAGASLIKVHWVASSDWQELRVEDNGCGMDKATLERALDPFYTDGKKHRNRRVGLGLSFLKQMVEETGGSWAIESAVGEGTQIQFRLNLEHVDVPPIGDVIQCIGGLMAFAGTYGLEVLRSKGGDQYMVRRADLLEALGDLDSAASLILVRDYIASQEEALQKG